MLICLLEETRRFLPIKILNQNISFPLAVYIRAKKFYSTNIHLDTIFKHKGGTDLVSAFHGPYVSFSVIVSTAAAVLPKFTVKSLKPEPTDGFVSNDADDDATEEKLLNLNFPKSQSRYFRFYE